jgi:hypothetical protein
MADPETSCMLNVVITNGNARYGCYVSDSRVDLLSVSLIQ